MNIKRVVLFSIVLMIAISSVSIVSAGFFDSILPFGEGQVTNVSHNLTKYKEYDYNHVNYTEMWHGNVSVEINISKLTDEQKESLNESLSNYSTSFRDKGAYYPAMAVRIENDGGDLVEDLDDGYNGDMVLNSYSINGDILTLNLTLKFPAKYDSEDYVFYITYWLDKDGKSYSDVFSTSKFHIFT